MDRRLAEPVALPKGERFGKFIRVSQLGAGGMGEVWKAWDTQLARWVALKFLKNIDSEESARFLREAQTVGGLNHPNIAAVYEAGIAQGRPFIAMQLVDGQTLKTFPRKDVRLLVQLMRVAAAAVHHAHELGIVHRDLKPENLMVGGGSNRVYVMDFGLARQVRSDRSISGRIEGTPAYMSPEQAAGARVDARADIYGLGATLYELLTDRKVFAGANIMAVLRKIETQDPRPPRAIDPRIDRELETIVLKCLEKDPARRYQTADELAEELKRWLAGEAILAHPPSLGYRIRKALKRRRALVAVGAIGAVAVAASLMVLLPQLSRETEQRERSESRRSEEEMFNSVERELDMLRMNFYRANYRMIGGEYQKQISRVKEQMKTTGPSARGWFLIGRLAELRAEFEPADAAYAEAMKLDPRHARTLISRGRMALEQALYHSAAVRHDASRQSEAFDQAREATEWVQRGAAIAGPECGLEADLAQAYCDLIQRKPVAAERLIEKWSDRRYVEEFLLVDAIQARERRFETASNLVTRMPSLPAAYLWRGIAKQESGDVAGAIDDYTRATEINPSFYVPYLNRSGARIALKDFEGALADCNEVLRIRPRSVEGLTNRGRVRVDQGDFDAAIADYSEALRIDPNCSQVMDNLGVARSVKGDFDGAIATFTDALRLNPKLASAYNHRGISKRKKGDLAGALADYEAALELEGHYINALAARAEVRFAMKNFEGAIADFTTLLSLDPRNLDYRVDRGSSKLRAGDKAGAAIDYRAALEAAPADWPKREATERVLRGLNK